MKMHTKMLLAAGSVFGAMPAFAQDAAVNTTANAVGSTLGWIGIAVGILLGLAVLGGTMGQGRAAAAALDGIARNPGASGKFTVPLILSLALMESLVLFAFLISLSLQGSISAAINKAFGM